MKYSGIFAAVAALILIPALILAVALAAPGSAAAREYFIAPGGDGGDGSAQAPFASIAKAFAALEAGDVLTFRKGEYRLDHVEKLTFRGREGAPITLRGEDGAVLRGVYDKKTNKQPFKPDTYCGFKIFGRWGAVRNLEFADMGGSCMGGEVENFVFQDLSLHDYSNYGLILAKSKNILVSGCRIGHSAIEHGIYLTGPNDNVHIVRSVFFDTAINGVHINGGGSNVLIEKCVFYGNSREWGACVTSMHGSHDIIIRNNIFYNNLGHIFTFGEGRATVEHNTVYNDTDRNGQVFIIIGDNKLWTVRNNVFATNNYAMAWKNPEWLNPEASFDGNVYSEDASQRSELRKVGYERGGIFDADLEFVSTDDVLQDLTGLSLKRDSPGAKGAPLLPDVPDDFLGLPRHEGGAYGAFASTTD